MAKVRIGQPQIGEDGSATFPVTVTVEVTLGRNKRKRTTRAELRELVAADVRKQLRAVK